MSEQHDIRSRNEMQFRQIALRVLKQAGFEKYVPEKKFLQPQPPQGLLKKDDNIYCLETFHSRRELYTSRAILNTAENLIQYAKKNDYLLLIVVGGVLIPALKADILGRSIRTVILDIQNLLYMARDNQDLYDELLAQLPYSPDEMDPREPNYLPMKKGTWEGIEDDATSMLDAPTRSDQHNSAGHYLPVEFIIDTSGSMCGVCINPLRLTNETTGETKEYSKAKVKVGRDPANDYHIAGKLQVSRCHAAFLYENQTWFLADNNSKNGTFVNGRRLTAGEKYQLTSNDRISFSKQETVVFDKQVNPEQPLEDPVARKPGENVNVVDPNNWDSQWDSTENTVNCPEIPSTQRTQRDINGSVIYGRAGTGKSSFMTKVAFEMLQKECEELRREIKNWQGGKQTNSAAYEKLCTRTLMRIFADDLTLWREQAKSNSDLFRFDLICKIKRDNHKDFWEMAERYFSSKYIIFEFKNYSGKVTQKEVYTTVRYLYTKAMRGIAIIISPNGMDENGGKACRGVLRDEGKLILSLTNEDLLEMLRMKEDGEDPADFLSDKLDELLIDLEK